MKTYWDTFIDNYKKELADLSLRQILELFFIHCRDNAADVEERLLQMKKVII